MSLGFAERKSLTQLRALALQCGINTSGTKATLASLVTKTLLNHQPLAPGARVLSIDLGIRNLAYSLLIPPAVPTLGNPLPIVRAWRPLALVPPAGEDDAAPDFSPASLSQITLSLVQEHLLPLKPTHVLVERQRFRSGGGSGVYEWTVRVNSLEAMLYATFTTLKALGHWDGVVIPVDPKRVGTFMLENPKEGRKASYDGDPKESEFEENGTEGNGPQLAAEKEAIASAGVKGIRWNSAREKKKQKIDLLAGWLARDQISMEGIEAQAMKIAFLEKWFPKKYRRLPDPKTLMREGLTENMKKLDDVTDSLLQGIAWIRWEENKTKLIMKPWDLHEQHGARAKRG